MTFTKLAKVRAINKEGEVRYLGFKLQIDGWFKMKQAYGRAPEEKIFWQVFAHFVREYFQENPGTESDFLVEDPYRFHCLKGVSGCEDWAIEIAYDSDYPTTHSCIFHLSMYGKVNFDIKTDLTTMLALATWKNVVASVDKKFTLGEGDEEELVEFFFQNPRDIHSKEGWVFEEKEIKISNFFEGAEEDEQSSEAPAKDSSDSPKEFFGHLF